MGLLMIIPGCCGAPLLGEGTLWTERAGGLGPVSSLRTNPQSEESSAPPYALPPFFSSASTAAWVNKSYQLPMLARL